MLRLFTIGYEGSKLEDFIDALEVAGVDVLLDVRELPISRRKGFSKNALSTAVTEAGMTYHHDKRLGSPKAMRHRLYDDGDYDRFFRDFRRYLATQNALLIALPDELDGNVALMCYERQPDICHRKIVAEAFSAITNITPEHLGVQPDAARNDATRAHLGEGVSPA